MNKTVTMSISLIRCNIISSIKPKAYIKISRKTECTDLNIKSWGWSVSIHIFCLCWEGMGEATTFALILRCYWIQWVCTYECPDPHLEQYMIYLVNLLYCLISNTYGYNVSMHLWLCKSIEPRWYNYSYIFVVNTFPYWNIMFTFICILFANVLVALC